MTRAPELLRSLRSSGEQVASPAEVSTPTQGSNLLWGLPASVEAALVQNESPLLVVEGPVVPTATQRAPVGVDLESQGGRSLPDAAGHDQQGERGHGDQDSAHKDLSHRYDPWGPLFGGSTIAARATGLVPDGGRPVPAGGTGGLHALDEPLDTLVVGTEGVLAQDGALGLVVQLEVDPVHGEVAATLLGMLDEVPPQPRARRLRRPGLGLEDLQVVGDPGDRPALLQQVVQPAATVDVVIGEISTSVGAS